MLFVQCTINETGISVFNMDCVCLRFMGNSLCSMWPVMYWISSKIWFLAFLETLTQMVSNKEGLCYIKPWLCAKSWKTFKTKQICICFPVSNWSIKNCSCLFSKKLKTAWSLKCSNACNHSTSKDNNVTCFNCQLAVPTCFPLNTFNKKCTL